MFQKKVCVSNNSIQFSAISMISQAAILNLDTIDSIVPLMYICSIWRNKLYTLIEGSYDKIQQIFIRLHFLWSYLWVCVNSNEWFDKIDEMDVSCMISKDHVMRLQSPHVTSTGYFNDFDRNILKLQQQRTISIVFSKDLIQR